MTYEHFTRWAKEPASLTPSISVVVPAYNEARRVVPTLVSIAATMCEVTTDFEIVLSDDGSTDDTPQLVRNLGLRNVIVLDPGVNRGKGAAVRAGVHASNGELILFSDADMSTPMREIVELRRRIEQGADVAIGSRAAEGAVEQSKSTLRRLFSWGWRRITRIGLGLDVADTQCGFKLFRRDAAMALFGAGRVDGFSFDAELLFLAARFDLKVAEVPVEWFDAPGSKVRPGRVAVGFLVDLVKIRLDQLLGRYRSRPTTGPDDRMSMAIVTAVPPSDATLTEYGRHLVHQMATKPEVTEIVVYAEDSAGMPDDTDGVRHVPAWTFDAVTSPWRIVRRVRRERPDVVFFNIHFTSFGSNKVAAALGLTTPALVRAFTSSRSVVLLHNIVDTVDLDAAGFGSGRVVNSVLRSIGTVLTRIVLLADRVLTTMPQYVDVLRDRYGADNVYLTPHGTFDTPSEPVEENDGGPFRILAFGKFGTYKRVDDLVEAHRRLLERGHHVECVVAGTDSPNAKGYLAGVAAAHADTPGLRFTGYVEEVDVARLFTDSNVVVFPYTSTTGSSGPLHQTGSYARAAVVPRVGDFVDLIEREGFGAVVFEPGDVDSLADAIAELIVDPDRRRRLGRQNFAAACSLPLEHVVDWHISHVEEVTAGVRRAA